MSIQEWCHERKKKPLEVRSPAEKFNPMIFGNTDIYIYVSIFYDYHVTTYIIQVYMYLTSRCQCTNQDEKSKQNKKGKRKEFRQIYQKQKKTKINNK